MYLITKQFKAATNLELCLLVRIGWKCVKLTPMASVFTGTNLALIVCQLEVIVSECFFFRTCTHHAGCNCVFAGVHVVHSNCACTRSVNICSRSLSGVGSNTLLFIAFCVIPSCRSLYHHRYYLWYHQVSNTTLYHHCNHFH